MNPGPWFLASPSFIVHSPAMIQLWRPNWRHDLHCHASFKYSVIIITMNQQDRKIRLAAKKRHCRQRYTKVPIHCHLTSIRIVRESPKEWRSCIIRSSWCTKVQGQLTFSRIRWPINFRCLPPWSLITCHPNLKFKVWRSVASKIEMEASTMNQNHLHPYHGHDRNIHFPPIHPSSLSYNNNNGW